MKKFYVKNRLISLSGMLLMVLCLLASCNKDDVIEEDIAQKPIITLDSETGIYTLKIGRTLTITPTVEHAERAMYSWLLDGKLVGSEASYTFTARELGEYYLIFRVETEVGSASEEMRVDVVELAPPVISFALPESGLTAESGRSYTLAPDVQNKEGASFEWKLDGEACGTDETFTFKATEPGNHSLTLKVENEDGKDERTLPITVIERYPVTVQFLKPHYFAENNDKTVALGRSIYLRPYIEHAYNPEYSWEVDGKIIEGATERMYVFTPSEKKSYKIKVTVTDRNESAVMKLGRNVTRTAEITASAEVNVICHEPEGTYKRSATGSSSPTFDKVYAFVPAPGQFVNEIQNAGYTGNEDTHTAAIAYAEKRLKATAYVSLGGWGGYIVVGFDHSIENKGDYMLNGEAYDFAITGNAFAGSSEPGIVYVMQDVNGNRKPDDEWYELKGSEYGKEETIQDYAVTYYRPSGPRMGTGWTDNQGNSGSVDYLGSFHNQLYYYPAWIEENSYTLYGTCLKSRVSIKDGLWYNGEFDWGYADNFGKDRNIDDDNYNADPDNAYFKISNAVHPDGTPANLQYIDFIKVQTGTNATAGALGENSTEVFQFKDMNILKQ